MTIKVTEYKSFDEFHESNTAGDWEHIIVVRENGWIKTDLITECKSYKTAIKRFFKNLAYIPEIADWFECVLESCESGYFKESDAKLANGELNEFRRYSWEVEQLDDGLWYIFLNVRAEAETEEENKTEEETEQHEMIKYSFTVGLFDKDTEKQRIESPEAKMIISNILINQFDIFAFTMFDCSGVYRMQSTGAIISEPSVRVEIATDAALPAADIISELKTALNQETIMMEQEEKDIYFL